MFKRKKKERNTPTKAMILEPGSFTEIDIETDVDGKMKEIKHNDRMLKPDEKKLFIEKNWWGKTKQRYQIFDLTTNLVSYDPVGMVTFDPTNTISAEEADLRIHESITSAATSSIVAKIRGVAVGKKWMIIVAVIVIVVASIAYLLHAKGVF